ncbi:SixA phosphatase family protein [Robertkochia solimangrovi]|uniref:SixA phosphatase family protein n=1 Tax=Robertkochia solimangrovi TaxID=2213046 RepID=UPI00117C7E9D|nr:phosphoglycerate mutase family protein [Robertkochia solimangrovi]TRZ45377.1 histidine phosphatase family protein [Robertkochia solimangrovi]
MKNIITLGTLLLFTILLSCSERNATSEKTNSENTTIIYMIRHAEKDRSDSDNRDPELTEEGKLRAQKWKDVFEHIALDKVFSTEYKRTQATASPTAMAKGLDIKKIDPSNWSKENFLEENKGLNVLVVGHSNTTPEMVNQLIGNSNFPEIPDHDNSRLYIVTILDGKSAVTVLSID